MVKVSQRGTKSNRRISLRRGRGGAEMSKPSCHCPMRSANLGQEPSSNELDCSIVDCDQANRGGG